MAAFRTARMRSLIPLAVAGVLLIVGVAGYATSAWGYGLFLMSMLLLACGFGAFSVFIFSRAFDTEALQGTWTWLLKMGAWTYVWAVAALSGFYIAETLAGRMETAWVLFGPAALAAVIAVDWGLYKLLVRKNLPTWQRFGHLVTRDSSDPAAMRRTFMDDVVLHRSLMSVSGFRWLRHTLIFWGFSLMFALELLAVVVREAWPAFGGMDIWEDTHHPIRLAFDFGYDFTGAMVLVGCVLAIGWRFVVNGTPEQKYSDTPTAVFLLLVVASGFVVEAFRLAELAADPVYWASFGGYALASFLQGVEVSALTNQALWYVHVFGSCAFIAYVPAKRLVHSCATPVGRMMHSQTGLLEKKRKTSLAGLMGGPSGS
jgi:hypothetical protein